MSELVFQNTSNKCQGWTNPNNLLFNPIIIDLSAFETPAGSNTLISINGKNFYSYSTVRFGTFSPTTYFINSNIVQFYVPSTLNSGTYAVQVYNGSTPSNTVNFTIDNASGYWLLGYNGNIINTNNNGVNVSWISKGPPVTITNSSSPPTYTVTQPYIVPNNVNWIICDDDTGGPFYIQLPTGFYFSGREITIKGLCGSNIYASNGTSTSDVIYTFSSSSNSTPQDIILPGNTNNKFYWATLVYDGNYWHIMTTNSV